MGCHRINLLGHCMVGSSGDETSLVSRNRHYVPASHPSPPVEEDRDRYQRRRVDYTARGAWEEFVRCVKVGRLLRASREVHVVLRAQYLVVDLNPCATELSTAVSHAILRSIIKLCNSKQIVSFLLCASQCWNGDKWAMFEKQFDA